MLIVNSQHREFTARPGGLAKRRHFRASDQHQCGQRGVTERFDSILVQLLLGLQTGKRSQARCSRCVLGHKR